MLVETMTPEEITREIFTDWETLAEKTLPRLAQEYDRARKRLKVNKESRFAKMYEIKTKKKNNWFLVLNKGVDVEKYRTWRDIDLTKLVYYYTKRGIRVFEIIGDDDKLAVYNAHLFSRYRERMKLDIPNPYDVVKHFFINDGYTINKFDDENDFDEVFSPRKNGIVLGTYLKEMCWTVYNTFITNEMKFEKQSDMEQQLIEVWEEESNIEFLLNGNSSYFKAIRGAIIELQKEK